MGHLERAAGAALAPPSASRSLTAAVRAITTSRANYCASYATDLACPLGLAYIGTREAVGWGVPLVSLGTGLFVFSFIEYAIHRWLFHRPTGLLSAMHQAHHDAPHSHAALPFLTSAAVAAICWTPLAAAIGHAPASFFLCGVMAGYFYYGAVHHLEHNVRISAVPFRWMQRRWAMHSVHHHLADTNYGVTSSLWDRVFGTHYQAKKKGRDSVLLT